MTINDAVRDVHAYLRRRGWSEVSSGPAGALWSLQAGRVAQSVAVPRRIAADSHEWRSVLQSLALSEERPATQIGLDIQRVLTDVTRFRAANDIVIRGSIPLHAGVTLAESALRMIRATATTSRTPKARIRGNYSKVGDEIANSARLGHTEEGSYILPVLMPISGAQEHSDDLWSANGSELERAVPEPDERRVTRTLAEALTAVSRLVVEPARDPRQAETGALIAAGASHELLVAIREIISEQSVSTFETSFQWAPAVPAPPTVPQNVEIPAESIELISRAATLLAAVKPEPVQRLTGLIVELRHEPHDAFGEFALQTMRNGRSAEVRVRVRNEQLDPVHDWMRTSRTVLVEGQIRRALNRLRIDDPAQVMPLDETFLISDE
ncbi:hypothetical protein [Promicromonospora sp. NPDC059942]|uniref:hypothetical protein n=1 Tax=Promicromonospora sp. NPDC059942 TaxID=3347009 RepID=UPI00364C27AB